MTDLAPVETTNLVPGRDTPLEWSLPSRLDR
jgi:hypothetical protein